ncbi:methyltransferase domain-containing protein [Desulfoluna spongiiphila]|uniref:methyltransferase domain-containing protein n=1 Tax=Desulfoluna spongiiphila TaxID=419481 RepID=UPI00125957C6|nr:methyltransferase domain-containing protein [Desulfoluna spongiiphila]VVS94088.1 s-adenosyl-l-methionine-dependent methyltransferase [Desulfoluna spongiiphila]
MHCSRSYRIKEFSTNVEGEVNRLRSQVDLFWQKEVEAYRRFGLKDGMRVLECGSGPGHVIENLLTAYPGCRATAIEVDPYLVAILKERLEGRCDISEQSIMDLGFTSGSFDFVITRLVLEHLPDPLGAVREVHRVLKPGGRAVFVDNDFAMHLRTQPEIPELGELYEAYCRLRVDEGGNPLIGRELPPLLRKGGFIDVDLEVVCAHSAVTGDDMFLKSEGVGIPSQLVKDGYLPSGLLDRLAVKWHRVLRHEHHSIFRQLFVSGGEKRASGSRGIPKLHVAPGTPRAVERGGHGDGCVTGLGPGQVLAAQPHDRLDLLTSYVVARVADALGISPESLEGGMRINDLGFDSLMAVEVMDEVESQWGVSLSLMDFFEGQSLDDITATLYGQLFEEAPKGPAEESQAMSGDATGSDEDVVEWEEGDL